ncbi:hypothetical protein B0H13DRAFT_1059412 [Mycena leptocephala]|nr:hypothetical protein B0H13DRAFT_1059412 [Mycena leptocephala]
MCWRSMRGLSLRLLRIPPQTPLSMSRQWNPASCSRPRTRTRTHPSRTRALLPTVERGQPVPAHAPFSFPFAFPFHIPLPFAVAYICTRTTTFQKVPPRPKTTVRPPAARDAPRTWAGALPPPRDLGGVARDRVVRAPHYPPLPHSFAMRARLAPVPFDVLAQHRAAPSILFEFDFSTPKRTRARALADENAALCGALRIILKIRRCRCDVDVFTFHIQYDTSPQLSSIPQLNSI